MRKCSLKEADKLFAEIAKSSPLYLPVDNSEGQAVYTKWEKGVKWSNALNTAKSPKDLFFPQVEDLVRFKTQGKNIEIIDPRKEDEDFVVFGVRACDARAFKVLDNVFMKAEPEDTYYTNKRKHSTVVSLACTRPTETCFCGTFDIDAANPEGDVTAWKTEDAIYFKSNNEKGEKFLKAIEGVTEESDDKEVKAQIKQTKAIMKKLPLADLKADAFGAGKTKELFDRPEWASLSESCLGCGTCTFVCPTCQCYDIKEFNTGREVIRYRCWDSCMYSEFTKMSAGQPRLTQLERFRQRFMHKLVYYPENNDGLFMCVGCGRCLAKCPIHMNIVKVMKTLGGKAK